MKDKFLRELEFKSDSKLWLPIERLISMTLSFLASIAVIRYLGPEQYGSLSYLLALSLLFGIVVRFGMDMSLVKAILDEPENENEIIASAWVLRCIASLIQIFTLLIIYSLTKDTSDNIRYLVLLSVAVSLQSFWLIEPILNSRQDYRAIAICKLQFSIVSLVIKIALILQKAPFEWFVLSIVADFIIMWCIYAINQSNLLFRLMSYRAITLPRMIDLIKRSSPILLSSLSVVLYMKMDQIMVYQMLGEYDAGIYAASVRIVEAFFFVPIVYSSIYLPILIKARLDSFPVFKQAVTHVYGVMFYSGLLIGALTFISAQLIILMFYGDDFIESTSILRILCITICCAYVGSLTTTALVADNLHKVMFVRTLAAAGINIVLNFWLIGLLGIEGAAIATVITSLLSAFIFDLLKKQTRYLLMLKIKSIVRVV